MNRNFTTDELRQYGVQAHPSAMVHCSVLFFGAGPFLIGDGARIDAFSVLTGNVTIGKRVHVGVGCYLQGACQIELMRYSGLSAGTKIYTVSDDYIEGYMAGPNFPPEMRKPNGGPVFLFPGATVGSSSIIMPGVTIGMGAAVGALSLVKKWIPDFEIWAGVPAKRTGERQCIRMKEFMKRLDEMPSS